MPCGPERKRLGHPAAPEQVPAEKPADPPPVYAPAEPGREDPRYRPPAPRREEVPVGGFRRIQGGSDEMLALLGMTRAQLRREEVPAFGSDAMLSILRMTRVEFEALVAAREAEDRRAARGRP